MCCISGGPTLNSASVMFVALTILDDKHIGKLSKLITWTSKGIYDTIYIYIVFLLNIPLPVHKIFQWR